MPRPDGRPLFIIDCDEVILHQAGPIADWLRSTHDIDYPLSGDDPRYIADGAGVPTGEVARLLRLFADTQLHRQTLVEGAREALDKFATIGDVVILTNIPARYHQARIDQLATHGIYHPVHCNVGLKGRAVANLIERYQPTTTTFIDDHPAHHDDVAREAPQVRRIQLIGDVRLTDNIQSPSLTISLRLTGWWKIRQEFSCLIP